MSATVFDGKVCAQEMEKEVAAKVTCLGRILRIATVVFGEDENSLLYTRLKQEAAVRVGIEFSQTKLAMTDSVERIHEMIRIYGQRSDIAGVLIQKPEKEVWRRVNHKPVVGSGFNDWWREVVRGLDPGKDVDCLTEVNLTRLYMGNWVILPATVRAVVEILAVALPERRDEKSACGINLAGLKLVIVGRSDIVGRPLASVLGQAGGVVWLFGHDLDEEVLGQADVVVSATGVENLIKGEMVKEGVVAIDVGSPRPDIEFASVTPKARFITPVTGGVGPMTVACLLMNLVEMVS